MFKPFSKREMTYCIQSPSSQPSHHMRNQQKESSFYAYRISSSGEQSPAKL